jgi:hypothetical protein
MAPTEMTKVLLKVMENKKHDKQNADIKVKNVSPLRIKGC